MNNNSSIILAIIIIVGVLGVYFLFYFRETRGVKKERKKPAYDASLQLQAYERLTILAERISLKNLISRLSPAHMEASAYHVLLVESIKQEYEYNLSQQLYVSAQAWQAVTNLKEQNIFILHQLAHTLPETATGMDLSKRILELLDADPKTSLHSIVLDALRYEARQLMAGA
ncbi:hypothetical protein [Agriterribacter sp.]|uniref:DUF7935 family protein n=1 Tax=Agriterribacter sp. TaxID=2821509 RepID=UPI002C554883|nr:hypothetical protein [Agriterribacter sp.]HRO46915.1 hypothetical protein [Agriterribacter sp.]HRQ17409.1 hypothetical protein [Agriterribacter sp.]